MGGTRSVSVERHVNCRVSYRGNPIHINNSLFRQHLANSHSNFGWQKFSDKVIKTISDELDKVVFLLWGGFAHKKSALVDQSRHVIIKVRLIAGESNQLPFRLLTRLPSATDSLRTADALMRSTIL